MKLLQMAFGLYLTLVDINLRLLPIDLALVKINLRLLLEICKDNHDT